jgi:hypothetical protein
VAQEIASSLPERSVNAFRQPAGGLEESTAPLLSAAKHAEVLGQDIPVMTALAASGCTGIAVLHPRAWAGVTDAAGEALATGAAWLAVPPEPVFAAGAAGPSGAVSLAA